MGDYIVRAMSADGFVKAAAIRSTEIVRRGAAIQGTTSYSGLWTGSHGNLLAGEHAKGGGWLCHAAD